MTRAINARGTDLDGKRSVLRRRPALVALIMVGSSAEILEPSKPLANSSEACAQKLDQGLPSI
jgi:hypothetical protein